MEQGGNLRFLLRLHFQAVIVHRGSIADCFDGMSEKVPPDIFVQEIALCIFAGISTRSYGAVSFFRITANVAVGDQSSAVAKWERRFVHIHNGAKLMESEQLPGAAVVVRRPSSVEHVRESENTIGWCF
jgi:hypothetical protein